MLNVATPLDAVAVVVPISDALPETLAVTTVELSLDTNAPEEDCTSMAGWVVNAAADDAPAAAVATPNFDAVSERTQIAIVLGTYPLVVPLVVK